MQLAFSRLGLTLTLALHWLATRVLCLVAESLSIFSLHVSLVMSLLSTPSTGSWSRLLYFLSHFLVPPPPPLSSPLPLTLCTSDDDSLLLLFSTLALPHLLTLRGVSRRFAYLIERYTLPQFRTLLYGYSEAERTGRYRLRLKPQIVDLYFSRSVHPYTDFCRAFDDLGPLHEPFYRRPRQVHPSVLCLLPVTLPRLLPGLSCLTFTCYLDDPSDPAFRLSWECRRVNRLLSGYLQSTSWTTSLVSLHLYLDVFWLPKSVPFPCLESLSQFASLRHLLLQLGRTPFQDPHFGSPLLPDSLPVLGQLTSFGLHQYSAANTALLLRQLGPNLVSLSLNRLNLSVADFSAFLGAKPTYRHTLRTLEISLLGDDNAPLGLDFPIVCQCLPSLERLYVEHLPTDNLRELLFNLCGLPALRELSTLRMSLQELRALRDNYPRGGEDLPRLPSIRTLPCSINNWPDTVVDFTPEELFNTLLPLLARIFSHLEHLTIHYWSAMAGNRSVPLSEALASKAKASFPHLLTCKASYYV